MRNLVAVAAVLCIYGALAEDFECSLCMKAVTAVDNLITVNTTEAELKVESILLLNV